MSKVPQLDKEPPKPTEGRIQNKGGNQDAKLWKVVEMKDDPKLFKVIDLVNRNIADQFKSQQAANIFITWHKWKQSRGPITPPGPKPTPTPTGKNITKDGVQMTYGTIDKILYTPKDNFRDDGKRYDFKNLKQGEFTSAEGIGYFKFISNPVDDEISGKFSYMDHSGTNDVNCYDMGVSIKTGDSRVRFENPHPNYSSNLAKGITKGKVLNDKWIGYKFVKKVQKDGNILLEIYQDVGDNETKPANQWTKLFNHTDTKYKKGAPPNGHNFTLRVDDPAKQGQKNLQIKWTSLAAIV